MARPPIDEAAILERYGPHLNYEPPGGWQSEAQDPAQKLVRTHCCFCGQQCGIQLKVRDNKVVGFEPWEEFPFNRGKLCPKGVKRYLQSNHPDRLLEPLLRQEDGFRHAVQEFGKLQLAQRRDGIARLHNSAQRRGGFFCWMDDIALGMSLHDAQSTCCFERRLGHSGT